MLSRHVRQSECRIRPASCSTTDETPLPTTTYDVTVWSNFLEGRHQPPLRVARLDDS
jgi:hypothetical protein